VLYHLSHTSNPGDKIFKEVTELKMRSFRDPNPVDWCPEKKRLQHRERYQQGYVCTKKGPCMDTRRSRHLKAKERGFRRN
jgi:hypothetical protein